MPNLNFPDLSKIPKRQLVILAGGALLAVLLVVLIMANLRRGGSSDGGPTAETLTVWGVLPDAEGNYLADAYGAVNPELDIRYRSFDPARYEEELLDALAAGEGPDIFMVGNRSLEEQASKLFPLEPQTFPIATFQELYPSVVADDFTRDGKVYALPLFIDTLALYYSEELFDQAAIVLPPRTWSEFEAIVPVLRSVNDQGQVVKAAAAIGGSLRSIPAAPDIAALLMLQRGVPIVGSRGVQLEKKDGDKAGLAAFNFYLQFANPASPLYTWNDNFGTALDAFASGKAAMMFDYRSRTPALRERAPFLRFAIAPMPQLSTEGAVNYPAYWGLAVSKQAQFPKDAWNFILRTAASEPVMKQYSAEFSRPPALRRLIGSLVNDAELGVFARQALTARSWREPDADEVQDIFSRAIGRVLTGQAPPDRALGELRDQLEELLAASN